MWVFYIFRRHCLFDSGAVQLSNLKKKTIKCKIHVKHKAIIFSRFLFLERQHLQGQNYCSLMPTCYRKGDSKDGKRRKEYLLPSIKLPGRGLPLKMAAACPEERI